MFCLTGSCQVLPNENASVNSTDTIKCYDEMFLDSVNILPLYEINPVCDSVLSTIVQNCNSCSIANKKSFGFYFFSEKKELNYLIYVKPMTLVIYENNPFYGCFKYSNHYFLCIGDKPSDLLYEAKDSVSFVYKKRIEKNQNDSIQYNFRIDRFTDLNTIPINKSICFNEHCYTFILQVCRNE